VLISKPDFYLVHNPETVPSISNPHKIYPSILLNLTISYPSLSPSACFLIKILYMFLSSHPCYYSSPLQHIQFHTSKRTERLETHEPRSSTLCKKPLPKVATKGRGRAEPRLRASRLYRPPVPHTYMHRICLFSLYRCSFLSCTCTSI
jgi:hypothetical protein